MLDARLVARGFSEFEQQRVPHASRVQTSARTWGDIWHVDGLAMELRDELFRTRSIDDHSRIEWLWGNETPTTREAS